MGIAVAHTHCCNCRTPDLLNLEVSAFHDATGLQLSLQPGCCCCNEKATGPREGLRFLGQLESSTSSYFDLKVLSSADTMGAGDLQGPSPVRGKKLRISLQTCMRCVAEKSQWRRSGWISLAVAGPTTGAELAGTIALRQWTSQPGFHAKTSGVMLSRSSRFLGRTLPVASILHSSSSVISRLLHWHVEPSSLLPGLSHLVAAVQ
jgi:hypothetical protein